MPTVHFVATDGHQVTAVAASGASVMQTALDASISGIVGECGGYGACGTCHVFVDDEWAAKVEDPDDAEQIMLDLTHVPRRTQSRLACQIAVTPELDGLVVHLPESQR
jgi:2Fe-2S ferredoxin